MSEDEVVVLVISLVAGVVLWCLWYVRCFRLTRWRSGSRVVWLLWLLCFAPIACGILLWTVLRFLAAHDVREAGAYLTLYTALGAAWVGMYTVCTGVTGISVRDDALERCNPAAAWAIAGGLIGLTLCFAGGNIGDGPGWWVVVYCGVLSTAVFFGCWAALEKLGGISELVTIERDLASGLRLAGFSDCRRIDPGPGRGGRLGVGPSHERRVPAARLARADRAVLRRVS